MTRYEINNPSNGYAPHWKGTKEYIEDITYRIWEQGDIDFIKDTYAKTCPIFTLASCFDDCDVVVKNTKSVLSIFPDRTLYPEDILWNGDNGNPCIHPNEEDAYKNVKGYHSSHLINSRMTYRHPDDDGSKRDEYSHSDFSFSANGKRARIWVIAHCIIRDGVIVREWLVRDNLYLFEQLGVCPVDIAKKWATKWIREYKMARSTKDDLNLSHYGWLLTEFDRVQSLQSSASKNVDIDLQNIFPVTRRGCCSILGNYIAQKFKKIWGKEGMASKEKFGELLRELYHPHARFDSPQNHDIVGHMEIESLYDSFVLGNRKGESIAMSVDWTIVKPQDEWRQGDECMMGEPKNGIWKNGNGKTTNAWVYPYASDVDIKKDLIKNFELQNGNACHEGGLVDPERYTVAIRWTLVGCQKQMEQENTPDSISSIPVVLLAESHLRCVGIRVCHEITVYDAVAVQAQIEVGKQLLSNK